MPLYHPPLPAPPPPPPMRAGGDGPELDSWWFRISGASGNFAMLGLGDIVLPALALAFGRLIDLSRRPAPPSILRGGYYPSAVIGYALGLAITLYANASGWTFNDVKGQPALLYLVPGVLGSFFLRAVRHGEVSIVWSGAALPTPPDASSTTGVNEAPESMGSDAAAGPLLPPPRRTNGCCCDYKAL